MSTKKKTFSLLACFAVAAMFVPLNGCQSQSAYRNAMFQAAMQHEYRQLEYDYDMTYSQLLSLQEENEHLRSQLIAERDGGLGRTSGGDASGPSYDPELLDDAPGFDSDTPGKLPSDRIPDFLNRNGNPQSPGASRRPYVPATRPSATQPQYAAPAKRETSQIERQREMQYYPPVSRELYKGFENTATTGDYPVEDENPMLWSP